MTSVKSGQCVLVRPLVRNGGTPKFEYLGIYVAQSTARSDGTVWYLIEPRLFRDQDGVVPARDTDPQNFTASSYELIPAKETLWGRPWM